MADITRRKYKLTRNKWWTVKRSEYLYRNSYKLIKMFSQEEAERDHTLNTNFYWFDIIELDSGTFIDIYRG